MLTLHHLVYIVRRDRTDESICNSPALMCIQPEVHKSKSTTRECVINLSFRNMKSKLLQMLHEVMP